MPSHFEWHRWEKSCREAHRAFTVFDRVIFFRRDRLEEDNRAHNEFEAILIAKEEAGETITEEEEEECDRLEARVTDQTEYELQEGTGYLRHEIVENLTNAHAILRRQLTVLAGSLIEGMILNFLQTLFENRPDQMYRYLGHGEREGHVSLKVITKAESLENLIQKLAAEAAGRLYNLPYQKMLTSLEKLCGLPYEPDRLHLELVTLLDARNRIVHDGAADDVSSDESLRALTAAQQLNEHLLWVSIQKGLPVANREHLEKYFSFKIKHSGDLPAGAPAVRQSS